MAKFQTGISIDEKVAEQAKELAERNRWNFSILIEEALKQFIAKYGQSQFPGLTAPLTPTETSVEAPCEVTR